MAYISSRRIVLSEGILLERDRWGDAGLYSDMGEVLGTQTETAGVCWYEKARRRRAIFRDGARRALHGLERDLELIIL